eukprot:4822281-Pyramimonas_sp.AAC.1
MRCHQRCAGIVPPEPGDARAGPHVDHKLEPTGRRSVLLVLVTKPQQRNRLVIFAQIRHDGHAILVRSLISL